MLTEMSENMKGAKEHLLVQFKPSQAKISIHNIYGLH